MDAFLIAFAFSFFWHNLGTSIGYHRLLTHRSLIALKPVEYFFVIGGYLCLEGSPVWWVTMHRAHHRYADTDLDPHTPLKGIKFAYNGWLGKRDYPPHLSAEKQANDVLKDPLYRFLEQDGHLRNASKLCAFTNIGFRVLLWVIFGWQVALASLLAGLLAHQCPLIINTVCHLPKKFGYRNFETKDDSCNVGWLSIATVGESWHNNHHTFPGSARFGLKKNEFDLTWATLKFLSWFGLVKRLHEPKIKFTNDFVLRPEHLLDPAAMMPQEETVSV